MRRRLAPLALIVAIIFAAVGLWGGYQNPPPFNLALAALAGFACAYACLRFVGLALAAMLAPLPGILWFGASAYALTLAFSILMAAGYAAALLKEKIRLTEFYPALLGLTGALAFSNLWAFHQPVQLPSLLAASLSALLFFPALAWLLPFGELAIARANRQRENLLRFSVFAARLAEPRWCLSLSGVGLVLAVLGYFRIPAKPPHFDWLAVGLVAVLVMVMERDVRTALAGLAAAAMLLLFTTAVTGSMLLFLLLALVLACAMAAWRKTGESVGMAWTRALEDHAASLLFAGLAAALAAGCRDGVLAGLRAGFAMAAALILFPAFAGALHHLFPGGAAWKNFTALMLHEVGDQAIHAGVYFAPA